MIPTALRFNRLFCVTCLIALTSHCPTFSQDLPTAKPEDVGVSSTKVEELSTYMQSLVDDGKIAGGVTMMARHGKVIHLKAVGMADREAGTPMRTDAIFRIASMTKPITSVAIMMLWEEGKLGLDDPVSKYIPEFSEPKVLVLAQPLGERPAKREITIRHLLTHMSGLGYTDTADVGPFYIKEGIPTGLCSVEDSLEAVMKRLGRLPLRFDPGERFQYGLSTDVLGRIVEVVSEMPLDRFMAERIFGPLGMTDTFFHVPSDKLSRVVSNYLPTDSGIRKLPEGERTEHLSVPVSSDYHLPSNKLLSGGGGLCSTAADYMRFCQMLLNGGELNGVRLLKDETVRLMSTVQTGESSGGFGFGFGVMPDTEDVHEQLRASFSWSGFWTTLFRISPRGEWAIVTMSQVGADDSTDKHCAHYEQLAAEAIEK